MDNSRVKCLSISPRKKSIEFGLNGPECKIAATVPMASGVHLSAGLPQLDEVPEFPDDVIALDRASNAEDYRPWDPVDEDAENQDDDVSEESLFFRRAAKGLKMLVYLCTFCVVLGCAVLSKTTFIFMTSLIDKDRTFPVCGESIAGKLEKDSKLFSKLSTEERWSWIWCIIFVLFVPELLTWFRCCRLCIFKKWQKPQISSFLMVLVMESLHVGGVVLTVFTVFPRLHAFDALCLTNAVCVVPSFVNLLSDSDWRSKRSTGVLSNAFHLLAFLGQASVAGWFVTNHHDGNAVSGTFGVVLVSCTWWENFAKGGALGKAKEDVQQSRPFIYLFVSPWKIVLLFVSSLAVLFYQGEDVRDFLELPLSFQNHTVSVFRPSINLSTAEVAVVLTRPNAYFPVVVAAVHVAASYLCYSCGKFACKICIQVVGYALPLCLTIPVAVALMREACEWKGEDGCAFSNVFPFLFWRCPSPATPGLLGFGFWALWVLSQMWITAHLWSPKCERMASTSKLFVNPMYCTAFIDQTLALNRRKEDEPEDTYREPFTRAESDSNRTKFPRIYACATMWHETLDEMEQLLKSIMRMDAHQCAQKMVLEGLRVKNPDYYEMEAHIFFDDAFVQKEEKKMTINSFVKDFIEAVNIAARKVKEYKHIQEPSPPTLVPTPYGGKLKWELPGGNPLIVHIKNKELIRHKKRWSQVMYMYYLLGYRLVMREEDPYHLENLLQNTFVLALDGDIDFRPKSVMLLVDLMNRNKSLGAACGRIHPVGSGLMVYYQKFEYAIGHWLQKSTEHMIGCVLCSPGCFSLFRAEALVKNHTIQTYASKSREAIEYVQFDQGEDRWLCTLLLQRGYRVEYSAASDAYTHCPETFSEFYTQRRRWAPSTMANIMDLIVNYRNTVSCNDNISRLYIAYQVLLMIGTILGPGTIFLMLVGAMVSAFGISNWQSFAANLVPIVFFILICFHAKNDTQILVAQIFSALYALLMMAVMVGMSLQLVNDGITSPTAIFIIAMTASFVIAALAHPQEFWCVAHGLVYFLSVPSMYLLLALYSFVNLHVVSWGTREVPQHKTPQQLAAEQLQAEQQKKKSGLRGFLGEHGLQVGAQQEEEGSISFGLANLFRCMCCTYPRPDSSNLHIVQIEAQLRELNSRIGGFRRRSVHLPRNLNLNSVPEDGAFEEESEDMAQNQIGDAIENNYSSAADNSPDSHPHWLQDEAVKSCPIEHLEEEETEFWNSLIKTYLYPLPDDPKEKKKASQQLLDLRNTVVFGILMLNCLFILIVFLLQLQKDTLHVEWPLSSRGKANITYVESLEEIRIDMSYLQLEPINLVLVFFFTLILVIQFVAMLFHRLETLSHILASTVVFESRDKKEQDGDFSTQAANRLRQEGLDPLQAEECEEDDDVSSSVAEEPTTYEGAAMGSRPYDEISSVADSSQLASVVLRQRLFLSQRGTGSSSCSVSLGGDRFRRRPKFKSLSIALEQNLKKMLLSDPKFAEKARRNSLHPEALENLIRRSSRGTITPSRTAAPSRTGSIEQNDEEALDRAFGNPLFDAQSDLSMCNAEKTTLEQGCSTDVSSRPGSSTDHSLGETGRQTSWLFTRAGPSQ